MLDVEFYIFWILKSDKYIDVIWVEWKSKEQSFSDFLVFVKLIDFLNNKL